MRPKLNKVIALFFGIAAMVVASRAYAQQGVIASSDAIDPCSKVTKVELGRKTLPNVLNAYQDAKYLYNGAYYLCFDSTSTAIRYNGENLVWNIQSDSSDVYLFNLNVELTNTAASFVINNLGGRVFLKNVEMKSSNTGIVVKGEGEVELNHVIIAGDGIVDETTGRTIQNGTGTCLAINSDNVIVKSSDISKCATGILLNGANNALLGAESLEKYNSEPSDKNNIHHNNIAVQISKEGNGKFTYNYLYGNGVANLAEILPISFEDTFKKYTFEPDEKGNRLFCKKDENEKILSRYVKMTESSTADTLSFLLLDKVLPEFGKIIAECKVKEDKTCEINHLSSRVGLSEKQCGASNLTVVALATDQKTSGYSDKFTLDGIASIIMLDSPGPESGTAGLGGGAQPGGDKPGVGLREGYDPAEDGGSSIDGITVGQKNPTDQSAGGAAPDSGLSAVGASMSCSLIGPPNIFAYFISIPLAVMRIARYLGKRKK